MFLYSPQACIFLCFGSPPSAAAPPSPWATPAATSAPSSPLSQPRPRPRPSAARPPPPRPPRPPRPRQGEPPTCRSSRQRTRFVSVCSPKLVLRLPPTSEVAASARESAFPDFLFEKLAGLRVDLATLRPTQLRLRPLRLRKQWRHRAVKS